MQKASCPKCCSTRTPIRRSSVELECTLPTCRHRWRDVVEDSPRPEVFTPIAPIDYGPAPDMIADSTPSADYGGGSDYSGGGGDFGGGGASGDY